MKNTRISLAFLLIVLMLAVLFSMTACLSEEDVYTREQVESMLAELNGALKAKDEKADADIRAAVAEYTAKISALEAALASDKAELSALKSDY